MSRTSRLATAGMRPCPLCGGSDRKNLFARDQWEIVQCLRCTMVFIGTELAYDEQAKNHDWMEEYQMEAARRKEKQPFMLFLSHCLRPFRPNPDSRMLSQTLRRIRKGALIDFGCGEGGFLALALPYFDVMGIELSPQGAEISRRKISKQRIFEGPVTEVAEATLGAETFDVVTQFGYIEHEWHPLAGLRAAWRVLKPGGITILKTPNFASWNRHLRGQKWCGYHIPAHCNYFTPRTLTEMLERAGFEVLPLRLFDRLPTSDSLWMAARKPA